MAEYYFSAQLDGERTLCLSPLTDRRIEMSGRQVLDTSGYFLYEMRGTGEYADISILAHLVDDEAAERVRLLLALT